MGGEVTFLCPDLVDPASHELPEAHKGVGRQPKRKWVVIWGWGEAAPVLKKQAEGASLEASVGCSHHVVRGEAPSTGEQVGLEEGGEGHAF